jgi:hypothetical protein
VTHAGTSLNVEWAPEKPPVYRLDDPNRDSRFIFWYAYGDNCWTIGSESNIKAFNGGVFLFE